MISHPTKNPDPEYKKSPGYREDKNLEKIPNPGDFAKIPRIKISKSRKIPKLRKIPIPGDTNPETKKIHNPGDGNPETKKIPNPGD